MRLKSSWIKLLGAVVLFGVMASNTMAAVLLSTLGQTIDGGVGGNPDAADQFATGNVGLTVTSFDLRWFSGYGSTTNRIGIFTDAAGLPSGTQVGTWFTSAGGTSDDSVINYVGNAMLSANTTYHLVIDIDDNSEPAFTATAGLPADPSTGASNSKSSSYGNVETVSWEEDPANLIWAMNGTVDVVPEPTSMAIFGLCAVGLAYRARRKTNKV